jgi:hypothetical protein
VIGQIYIVSMREKIGWHRPRTGSVFTIARQKSQKLLGLGWDVVGRGETWWDVVGRDET